MSPLPINDDVTLPADELSMRAVRSSGPGGQNVNKVSSKVELRFDLARSAALAEPIRERLRAMFRHRLDRDGRLVVISQATRDQHKNHADARDKLRALVLRALEPVVLRKPTKPKRSAKVRRVANKRFEASRRAERSPRGGDRD